ncbi:hypothetical protein TVAG_173930 [Trichomonas vaginalis G3]|uniref:Uncharacterized protein n=1 Tax=Trichomonas vaginalis (strain ATCC PRA-98 / G3) TaxID=412133 RepID=A2EWT6_TRIV3|nr:hypothetical protein TVAGG3_0813330 [Trichomonas vaginalis G3]EAY02851.1 hypothetical protein TVAG_173930 [Trichomonas vaginalis G3]KAI5497365.1 hypothetical protein TVAGG3_0813330 [Trichomonas vaginalis G3]|eukprot:XP_001315074.1 hypothetical protein [Trichomonas vaginalis G3]
MIFAFLLSFHLAALAQGRSSQSITAATTLEIEKDYYFVIINPQYFTVNDEDARVVYKFSEKTTITVKLSGSYTKQTIYYFCGKYDDAAFVDFAIGFSPAPLLPGSDFPQDDSQKMYTVFLPTADTTYTMQFHGTYDFLDYSLNGGNFEHKDNNDTYYTFDVKANQYYTIRIRPTGIETPLAQIVNQKITSTSLPDYYSVYGTYKYEDCTFWADSIDGSSVPAPVNNSALNIGINDLVFAKTASGNSSLKYTVNADSVFIITRTADMTGITGKVTYVENSKEKPSKEFDINDKTITIVCNVETTIEISSSLYPVVRVVLLDTKNVPYAAGWAAILGPADFSLTSVVENKTFAAFVSNPTRNTFSASSADYTITMYSANSTKRDSDNTSYSEPAIVHFKVGKLKDDIVASIQFSTHLFDTAYYDDIVFNTDSEESLQAGIYTKKASSNTGVIVGVTIAVIIVVGAVIAFVVYFRCFKYADSV